MPLNRAYYTSLIGGGKPSNRWSGIWTHGQGEGPDALLWDFTQGSLPDGMIDVSSSISNTNPTVTWAGDLALSGDAGSGNSYPLRVDRVFSGDYLFQLSVLIEKDETGTNYCTDPSLAIFSTPTNSIWSWVWGASSVRIAAQGNCRTPYLYGSVNFAMMSGNPFQLTSEWVTMHLHHRPSLSQTTFNITTGADDWNQVGYPKGSSISVSNSFSGDYYLGISADDDPGSAHFSGLKATAL